MFINKDTKNKIYEIIRFIMVGGTATLIHYSIYYLLQKINLGINSAYTLGYGISFIFNFIASNYFTFKTNISTKKGIKFSLCHILNYFIQILLLNIYIRIGISKDIAPIFVFLVAVPINYFLVRIALLGCKKEN